MDQSRTKPHVWDFRNCAVVVAHPAEETLWAGGTILLHPESKWTVVAVSGKNGPVTAERFDRAMDALGASGLRGEVPDTTDHSFRAARQLQKAILDLLPVARFDLVITHGPWEEYTRHRNHEDVGKAVFALWENDMLLTRQVWRFAYEDGGGKYLPRFVPDADQLRWLPEQTWKRKYEILTDIYGYSPDSFEAKTTPRQESFWCFVRQR